MDKFDQSNQESKNNLPADRSRFRMKKRGRQKHSFRIAMISVFVVSLSLLGVAVASYYIRDEQNQALTQDEYEISNDMQEINKENDINQSVQPMEDSKEVSLTNTPIIDETREQTSVDDEKIIIHTVKKGDSLYRLSLSYYDSADFQQLIASFNNITDSTSLHIGDELKIPFPPSPEWHGDYEGEDIMVIQDETVHEVKAGETLSSISREYYHTSKYNNFLAEYNNIKDADGLKVGDILGIPPQPTDG